MANELIALLHNGTWELVPPSPFQNIIGCKWVFQIKRNPDGSIFKYKACLVAKGFHQRLGVDYHAHLVWLSSPQQFGSSFLWHYPMAGLSVNWMPIMPFYMVHCLNRSICNNPHASLISPIRTLYVSYINQYTASNRPHVPCILS